jgi:hypothetical protein
MGWAEDIAFIVLFSLLLSVIAGWFDLGVGWRRNSDDDDPRKK